MAQTLTWDTASEVAVLLSQNHPDLVPSDVSFAKLQQCVAELPGFSDDPAKMTEGKLKAIREAWQMEYQERTQD